MVPQSIVTSVVTGAGLAAGGQRCGETRVAPGRGCGAGSVRIACLRLLLSGLLRLRLGLRLGLVRPRPGFRLHALEMFLLGDFGFLLGIAGVLYWFGTLDYRDLGRRHVIEFTTYFADALQRLRPL